MDKSIEKANRLKLLCGAPIYFYGKQIRVPSVFDISSLGYRSYSEKIFAFTIGEDFVKSIEGYGLSLFSTLVLIEDYRDRLIEGLCYFLNLSKGDISIDVRIFKDEDGFESYFPILAFGDTYINDLRFRELKDIILLVTNNDEISLLDKTEKKVEVKEEFKGKWANYLEGKAKFENEKKQKEQGMEMYKMISYLQVKTKYKFDYIASLNLEQFNAMFTGEVCEEKNSFELTKLSTGVIMPKDLDLKSLYDRLKVAIE